MYAGLVPYSRSHIAFTDAGTAGDQQVLKAVNEGTVRQAHNPDYGRLFGQHGNGRPSIAAL